MVVKKNNYLYENEQRLNDSILEKRLETCKGIIKSNMNLVKENIENECTVLIGRIDKDRIYVENKLIKIYMHKSGTYYYVYEFQYVKEGGLKYIRDEVKDCGKLL